MKTYNFSIEVDSPSNTQSILSDIVNEVHNEKRQRELTYSINKETTKQHMTILRDICDGINEDLKEYNLSFGNFRNDLGIGNNHYNSPMALMVVGNRSLVLHIDGESGKFPESKYTTYTGEFTLKYRINDNSCYTACQSHEMRSVNNVSDFFNEFLIKDLLKKYIAEYLVK